MRIHVQKNIVNCLVSGFLALALFSPVPADAQALKSMAAKWRTSGAWPTLESGFSSCEEALATGIEKSIAYENDPLIFQPADCPSMRPLGQYIDFYKDYRRSWESPEAPARGIHIEAYCDLGGPLVVTAARETICEQGSPSIGKHAGKCETCVGNPIFPGFGNKLQVETDYVGGGPFPLRFTRTHNSMRGIPLAGRAGLGTNWTHNYTRRLVTSGLHSGSVFAVTASRSDGKSVTFNLSGSVYQTDPDQQAYKLVKTGTGWQLTDPDGDEVETYDAAGRLIAIANRAGLTQTLSYIASGTHAGLLQSVTDPFGRTLGFAYQNGLLQTLTIPGGGTFTYTYDSVPGGGVALPITVTDPMGRVRTYHYENPTSYKLMLTGITDELGVRFATWGYDTNVSSPFQGMPTLSQHAGGAGKVTLAYNSEPYRVDVTTFVTNTVSATRTYGFQTISGVIHNNAITGAACPQCGPAVTGFFFGTTTGLPNFLNDWNGSQTSISYDTTRLLETYRLEGRGPGGAIIPETIGIERQWHASFRLPTLVSEPLRLTTNVYDPDGTQCGARGALCTKTVQATTDPTGIPGIAGATPTGAPRVWTYTYNSNGQVLTVNGPRTDVADTTTYTYDGQGNVATITNAAGHLTQITSYNVHGQPLTIIDPNGLTTTLTYDARQRLTERNAGGEITTYTYDFAGQLTKVTLPDTSFLSYGYDPAHRLTSITDNLGNKIVYTLDLAGNRTQEQVFDPTNALAQTRSRVYSSINRLFQELGATGQTTEYGYDPQGNVLTVKDPLLRTTTNTYDRRNRLKQTTSPAPVSAVTQYGYNGLSALTQVTDPRNLVTGYAVDGLGNLNQQTSPDTGTTTNTYDPAGNLLTQTDAKGQVTAYAYDALNRVTLITFHDLSTQVYTYDVGTNALGRLTSIAEVNPASVTTSLIAYGYDQKGRVTSETRTVNGVAYTLAYSYDSSGRLTGLTYPSGRTVTYTLDALGRVAQVNTTKDNQTLVVVQNVQYHPFGGAKSWTLGNGQIYSRTIDQDGRIASYTIGGTSNAIAFDAASRITGISTSTYGYDSLDRLTSAILPSSNFGYSYDGVGNRLTKTVGANTDTYTYSSTSNRIATLTPASGSPRSFILDANGSTTNDALNSFVYDTRGRMVQSTNSASTMTTYQVNALGQRIRKTNSNEDRVFTYDTWGKLIFESDPGGAPKREYIYLGDIPVGVVQ